MTAFAGAEQDSGNLTLNCELRSVNHRYCDLNLKIPERLRFAEGDIRSLISRHIKRGKIECAISYKSRQDETGFKVNQQAVKQLLGAAEEIENLMQTPLRYSAMDILAFPGIQQDAEQDKEALRQGIKQLLQQALNTLLENRAREGDHLQQLIEERNQKVHQLAEQGEARMPEVLSRHREKLLEHINELVQSPDMDRIEQELVIMAQKLDVAEELDRLKTHVEEVNRVLNQREPIGRRLDFLMQEMNREANTLGSKSADKEMTRIAIELKVLIEQMREQIQNIE